MILQFIWTFQLFLEANLVYTDYLKVFFSKVKSHIFANFVYQLKSDLGKIFQPIEWKRAPEATPTV